MKLSEHGLDLLRRHEGLRLEAYQDVAGIWTIGYGHVGPDVKPGLKITQTRAIELLRKDVERAEAAINLHVKVPLKQHEFDALVSFVFNVGTGGFKRSTLLKLLNAGQPQQAADQFLRWRKAGGRIVAGLVYRRSNERDLFLNGYKQ